MCRAFRRDVRIGFAAGASSFPKQPRKQLSVHSYIQKTRSLSTRQLLAREQAPFVARHPPAAPLASPALTLHTSNRRRFMLLRSFSTNLKLHQSPETTTPASSTPDDEPIPPPTSPLILIFTDIVLSTLLWESAPSAMKSAMDTHDTLLRNLMHQHHGYEVKQNGDGFMIAFQSATDALGFCLDGQVELLDVQWPEGILGARAGREVRQNSGGEDEEGSRGEDDGDGEGKVLYRGLRLRMSAHYGEAVTKWNEVAERMDYLGPLANRAARYIGVCEGGQIVVSREFLEELGRKRQDDVDGVLSSDDVGGGGPHFEDVMNDDNKKDDGGEADGENEKLVDVDLRDLPGSRVEVGKEGEKQFEVRALGKRRFKGIEEEQQLYFVLPYELRGRVEHWPKHMHVPGSKGNLVG